MLALTEPSFWRFYSVEKVLKLWIIQLHVRSGVEEGDATEEDEDDEDGIRFVTLKSRFENKETVLNW